MGEPIGVDIACGKCGEQIILTVHTDAGYYSSDLEALLSAKTDDLVLLKARCACANPRRVALTGAPQPSIDDFSDDTR